VCGVELVAIDPSDPEQGWYIQQYGGGIMIPDPLVSGRTFVDVSTIGDDEDLEFVARA